MSGTQHTLKAQNARHGSEHRVSLWRVEGEDAWTFVAKLNQMYN